MPAEVPYAESLDSATATSPEALSSLSADISLPHSTASSSASGHEKLRSFSPASVPHNLRPTTLNATKDMYWFAHMGEASQGNGSEGEGSPVGNEPPTSSADGNAKTSPAGKGAASPGHSESKEEAMNVQRDHEMRLRHYKELQEEDRIRKLTELQYASQQAQRFREQQEEDRRKKIDELRSKDVERRLAVEERKRLIWEAEQERKEAILRRNLEREAKIEARRNAQRNTMSIAFGSSTPRDIDLPAGTGTGTGMAGSRGTYGSMMALSSVNQPLDLYKKRTPSADVLDKDSDPMTRSLVILSSSRGRRKTDLTPTIPWEREAALRSSSPGNIAGNRTQAKRAVSMSRLDILAQPRRRPSANLDQTGQGVLLPTSAAINSTKGLHKDLHSPSRPRSSQSMASEQSVASTVSMRSQSGPRRARPFSIAGSIVPANLESGQVHHPLPPQRRSRTAERKVPVAPPTRPPRAKSVGSDVLVPMSTPKATSASRKPPVAPKPGPAPNKVDKEDEPEAAQTEEVEKADNQEKPPKEEEAPPVESKPEPEEQEIRPPPRPSAAKVEEPPKEGQVPVTKAPRISSEEEAKAALAEKRRLAREQAEREAEAERLRQEELRRQEEERIRLEEEEQRRMEEEQLRLAEELRKQEEEKLQKAIEEQQKKEEEEKARKEEENKMRLEKEEQERKQKEEAERQRKELEEKLKQEEAARAERKKRVEQIMKRTRNKEGSQKSEDSEKPAETAEAQSTSVPDAQVTIPAEEKLADESELVPAVGTLMDSSQPETTVETLVDSSGPPKDQEEEKVLPLTQSIVAEDSETVVKVNGTNSFVDSESKETIVTTETPVVQNGFQGEFVNGVVGKAKTGQNSEDVSPQTNGYSSHDVSLSEISPDEKMQQDVSPLLDFTHEGASNEGQWNQGPPPPPTEFDQLIDLSLETTNQNELNRLNNADELNSNRVPSIPFIAFEENVTRKQEPSLTDLLS